MLVVTSKYFQEAKKKFLWVGIFGVAFAFIESSVVVYLRQLFYPNGFEFPLISEVGAFIFNTEIFREAATILVLAVVAILAGKTLLERFSYFIYSFAVWDIFYYVWLKVILDWPASLFTWDVLFFIPVIWVGPVIAPILVSLTMIFVAFSIIYFVGAYKLKRILRSEWVLILLGTLLIVITFMWDFTRFIISGDIPLKLFNLVETADFDQIIVQYVPIYFNWPLFVIGEAIILYSIWRIYKRVR